jgi:ADP-heptose:LPS heptosyltransferase
MTSVLGESTPLARFRIAVFRALKLGDLLCATPALRALRRAWPTAEFTLIGLPWAREFVRRVPHLLNQFLEFPGDPRLPEREVDYPAVAPFFADARERSFDLAIQLHGTGPIVNPIAAAFGARRTAGFYRRGDECPDPETFIEWPERGLEVDRLLRLTTFLGCAPHDKGLEFPLRASDWDAARRLTDVGNYLVIHPGASVHQRRWPVGQFAAIADGLAEFVGRVVITGSASERDLACAVAAKMQEPAHILAGQTDLGALGAVIDRARLVVCNDTGVSHVAAARRTPSVVISSGDNPNRWAPADAHLHRVLATPQIQNVPVYEVLATARNLLMDEGSWNRAAKEPLCAPCV